MTRTVTLVLLVAVGAGLVTALVALQSGEGDDEAPVVPTVNTAATEPRRTEPGETAAASPPPSVVPTRGEPSATAVPGGSPAPTEGRIGPSPTVPGRPAADAESPPLRFRQVLVFSEAGVFAGRANVTNTGAAYLNGVKFDWRIVDESGRQLDGGTATWPSLAPGETATVAFRGGFPFTDAWREVRFTFLP